MRLEPNLENAVDPYRYISKAVSLVVQDGDWPKASNLILEGALLLTESLAGLIIVKKGEGSFRCLAVVGNGGSGAIADNRSLTLADLGSLLSEVISAGEIKQSNQPGSLGSPLLNAVFNSFLAVPIQLGSQLLGIIWVADRPEGYSTKEQKTLENLAQISAVLYSGYESTQAEAISKPDSSSEGFTLEQGLLAHLMTASVYAIYFKDRRGRFIRINDVWVKWCGLSHPDEIIGKTDFDFFSEEVAQSFQTDEEEIMASGQPLVAKWEKQVWKNGKVMWASTTKVPLRDVRGKIIGIIGITRDVTDRKQMEDALVEGDIRFQSLFHSMPEGSAIYRLLYNEHAVPQDFQIVAVNPAFEKHSGITGNVKGTKSTKPSPLPEFANLELFAEVVQTGQSRSFEYFDAPLDRHFAVSVASSSSDLIVTIFSNITERKRQETEIIRLNRVYAVLSQVNQAVVRVVSREELYQEVCDIAVKFGGFKMAWIGVPDPETSRVNFPASSGDEFGYLKRVKIFADDRPEGRGPSGICLREGRVVLSNDFLADPISAPWRKVALEYGIRAAVALPIKFEGKVIAALVVCAREKNYFHPNEVELLGEVAVDISFAFNHLAQEEGRREAEKTQAQSLSLLRATLESTADGILVVDMEGNILDFNEKFEMLRCLPASVVASGNIQNISKSILEEIDEPEEFLARLNGIYNTPEESTFDQVRFKDGRVFERYSIPQRIDGQVVGRVWSFRDITDRKQAEEELRESKERLRQSEEKFRSLFAASRDATMLLDAHGFVDCNQATLDLFGCDERDEFLFKHPGDLSPPTQPDGGDSFAAAGERMEATFTLGSQFFEWTHRRMDGTVFPAEVLTSRFEIDGQPMIQAVVRDISWRKAAEQQLRQLSRAVEQSPDAIMITNVKGEIEYVNPKFTTTTGYTFDEVLGKDVRRFRGDETSTEVFDDLWNTINTGKEWRGEVRSKRKNEEHYWESMSISPITDERGLITHFVSIREDITERKTLEERFLRAQRMESIGALAGGIAHDLNNILAPIMMSASMLHDDLSPEHAREFVTTIEEAAQRGADIVQQVLTFARGVEGQKMVLKPQYLIGQVERIVRETFPKSIAFVTALPDDLWNITGDLTQLHQVLLNLCVNARDAMLYGGTLMLIAENCQVDAKRAEKVPDAKPGSYVKLKLIDSGIGIPPEILTKIFDPFFTTKEVGKGTGLGLSTALGIIRSHGGFMVVESQKGQGSTFQLYLPATTAEGSIPDPIAPNPAPIGKGETILIVDDEEEIIKVTQAVLTRHGYRVLTASNGIEAVTSFIHHRTEIKLVLTDLMMPLMDGISLSGALKEIDPHFKIIAASGHGEESHQNELKALGINTLLRKPFSAAQLLVAVRHALDQ